MNPAFRLSAASIFITTLMTSTKFGVDMGKKLSAEACQQTVPFNVVPQPQQSTWEDAHSVRRAVELAAGLE
jgi:hypothetical protein